jgi:hypothetical protein
VTPRRGAQLALVLSGLSRQEPSGALLSRAEEMMRGALLYREPVHTHPPRAAWLEHARASGLHAEATFPLSARECGCAEATAAAEGMSKAELLAALLRPQARLALARQ